MIFVSLQKKNREHLIFLSHPVYNVSNPTTNSTWKLDTASDPCPKCIGINVEWNLHPTS